MRRAQDKEQTGRTRQQLRQGDLLRAGFKPSNDSGEPFRLDGAETAQREGDRLGDQVVQQCIVLAVDEIVLVLHAVHGTIFCAWGTCAGVTLLRPNVGSTLVG